MFIKRAQEVTFVEKYWSFTYFKKNLLNLSKNNNYNILEQDIYENNFFKNFKKKFDIIFLDPPTKMI